MEDCGNLALKLKLKSVFFMQKKNAMARVIAMLYK